uniref:Uncharacterized protein n=1 Tax=Ditylenchus dipsaci TaxID=166011 RepID=A0A915CTX2_9BILA
MDARRMLEILGGYSSDEDVEQQAVAEVEQQAVEVEDQAVVKSIGTPSSLKRKKKWKPNLLELQQGRDQLHLKWLQGMKAKGKWEIHQKADRQILAVVESYDDRTTEEFLSGIAHNYRMEDL